MLKKDEIKYLRQLGQELNPIFQVGKSGLSEDLIEGVNQALEKRELVKISILQNCPIDKEEVFFDLQAFTKSEAVQKIGKTIVLYRKSKDGNHLLK